MGLASGLPALRTAPRCSTNANESSDGTTVNLMCALRHCLRDFVVRDDGVTTIEWLVIAGVAVIIGVSMTYLATSNMSASANFVEGKVNAAASQ